MSTRILDNEAGSSKEHKKIRSVCFTLNNYTEQDVEHIKEGPFKFLVFQRETGANGTPHLQGYAQGKGSIAWNTWKRLLTDRAAFFAAKGTPRENYDYCTKEDTRDAGTVPFVRGVIPQPGQRTDIEGLVSLAKDPTKRMRDIIDSNGEGFVRYYKGIDRVRSIFSEPRRFQTEVLWFYGSTGTGKSRLADSLAPDAYWKSNDKWFDGYDPIEHDDIIIDDFRSNFHTFNFILRLFDRYPMQVEIKGGTTNFRAKRIFVTTSKHPLQTWETRSEEALDQLIRRLSVIVEFLPGGIKRFDKGDASCLEGGGVVDCTQPPRRFRASQAEEADEPRIGGPVVDEEEEWSKLMHDLDDNLKNANDENFLNDFEEI